MFNLDQEKVEGSKHCNDIKEEKIFFGGEGGSYISLYQ